MSVCMATAAEEPSDCTRVVPPGPGSGTGAAPLRVRCCRWGWRTRASPVQIRSRVPSIIDSRSARSRGMSSKNRMATNFSSRAASVAGASVASQPASAARISSPVW